MIPERIHYLKSNTYRHTLKMGDEITVIDVNAESGNPQIITGTVREITSRYIAVDWYGKIERDYISLKLGDSTDENRVLAFKMEDLTPSEVVELVTLRISQ